MLNPFLLVGVGGSGGKTLRGVRKALELKLEQEKWHGGWPDAWQFLHIDTPISQDGLEFPAPLLDVDEYLSLVPAGVGYNIILDSLQNKVSSASLPDLLKALPSLANVGVAVRLGAGAFRAIGRAISAASLGLIESKIDSVLARGRSASATAQLKELSSHLGIPISGKKDPDPTVIVVSSIAGGSGAGQFIDVVEAIKSAAGNAEWTQDIFALLYAPDVFDQLERREIPANALGAIAETMSGFWNRRLSASTSSLYEGQGLIPSSSPRYRTGPAYPYIIGRDNGQVSFGSQEDVYLAVSASVATWMIDSQVQTKLSSFTVANYTAKAPTLTDHSRLRKSGGTDNEPSPFSSMGFGRVTLGLERFFEYSSERLAREALTDLLDKHLKQDMQLKQKTAAQWLQEEADLAYGGFLSDIGLDQQIQEANQLLSTLNPDQSALQARMKATIEQASRSGMPQGGHSFSGWIQRIINGYEVNLPSVLADYRNEVLGKVRNWADLMPDQTLRLVAQTVSRKGLPVTVELLARTIEDSKKALLELERERRQLMSEAESLQTLVTQSMQSASSMAKIPPNNSAVAKGIHQAQIALGKRAGSDLREVAAEILADFTKNFLEPLRETLASAAIALRASVNDAKLPDGRDNPLGSWPRASDSVPRRFRPAPNERLLIDYQSYGTEFDSLVEQTVSDKKRDAKQVVLDEFIMGSYGIEGVQDLPADQRWTMVDVQRIWIPQNRQFQAREGAFQSARFSFLSDHMAYIDRAKLWLMLPDRTFGRYLDLTLAGWLADGNQAVQSQKQSSFIKEFEAAVASAAPLVKRNRNMMSIIHPASMGKTPLDPMADDVLFSAIPVAKNDPLYDPLSDVIKTYYPKSDFDAFFVGASGAPHARQIDIFSVTGVPVQPMALGSVMEPIAQEWRASSLSGDSRSDFIKWRRGRTLPESIPASPEIWNQMLVGWYVAKFFGIVRDHSRDSDSTSSNEKGLRMQLWIDAGEGDVGFPYPLYYPGLAPVKDLVGVVMESLTIALVNCYAEGSLKPLSPYKHLSAMGDLSSDKSFLRNWIKSGKPLGAGAPSMPADAGMAVSSAGERKAQALDYFRNQHKKFDEFMKEQDPYGDIHSYPVSWEIRGQVFDAMNRILGAIPLIDEESDEDEYPRMPASNG